MITLNLLQSAVAELSAGLTLLLSYCNTNKLRFAILRFTVITLEQIMYKVYQ